MNKYKARIHNSKILDDFINNFDEIGYAKCLVKMTIAKKIAEGMAKQKIGKKKLALKMKQQPSVITKWLSGTQNFTIDTMVELENELKIKLIY